MKGGGGKRRWKVLVIGVMVLVILSILVPLAFLLGLHNSFHSPGLVTVNPSTPYESFSRINSTKHSQRDLPDRVDIYFPVGSVLEIFKKQDIRMLLLNGLFHQKEYTVV